MTRARRIEDEERLLREKQEKEIEMLRQKQLEHEVYCMSVSWNVIYMTLLFIHYLN